MRREDAAERREETSNALQGTREETGPEDVLDRELLRFFTFLLVVFVLGVDLTDSACRRHLLLLLRARDLAERRVFEQLGNPRNYACGIGPIQPLRRSGSGGGGGRSTGTEHVDSAAGDRLAQGSVVQVVEVREERRPQGAQFGRKTGRASRGTFPIREGRGA